MNADAAGDARHSVAAHDDAARIGRRYIDAEAGAAGYHVAGHLEDRALDNGLPDADGGVVRVSECVVGDRDVVVVAALDAVVDVLESVAGNNRTVRSGSCLRSDSFDAESILSDRVVDVGAGQRESETADADIDAVTVVAGGAEFGDVEPAERDVRAVRRESSISMPS